MSKDLDNLPLGEALRQPFTSFHEAFGEKPPRRSTPKPNQPAAPDMQPAGSGAMREALKLAINHCKHMAAWIGGVQLEGKPPYGYSFEALGEDMPAMEAALSAPEAPKVREAAGEGCCTCHPDDRPEGKCRQRFAASECQADALREAKDQRRAALIERIGTVADLACSKPLEGELGDVAYDLLRQAAAQIASDRKRISALAIPAPAFVEPAEDALREARAAGRDEGVEAAIEWIKDSAAKHPGTPFARVATILAEVLQKVRDDAEWRDTCLTVNDDATLQATGGA